MLIWPVRIACPVCDFAWLSPLAVPVNGAEVTVQRCPYDEGGCGTQFAAEVRTTLTVHVHTCTLSLPSATRRDALADLETLLKPEGERPS